MSPGDSSGRLATNEPTRNAATTGLPSIAPITDHEAHLADLDALADSLSGYLVLQVVVDDVGHRRTTVYRSAGAAERAVRRARDRGRTAHVSLVQMLPVGVVVGLGVAR